jgi:hypothetical protein
MVPENARGKRWRPILTLIALTFAAHVLVLANPGYFSHDEWQRADEVEAYGLVNYFDLYTKIHAGPNFGFPVRPIGFVQQGISAIWMQSTPIIPHGIDVALHAAVVLLLWSLLVRVGFGRRRALLAGAFFAISPLATVSVGWVGASFDRWYVFFSLICAYGLVIAAREGLRVTAIALVLLGGAGAILSKEAAIALPAALLVMAYSLRLASRSEYQVRPALGAIALSALPVFAYLAIRWPAIQSTLSGHGGSYTLAPGKIPGNVLVYLAQPFHLRAVELKSFPLLPRWEFWLALALHVLLMTGLWRRFGWRVLLAYVGGYFVFLLPVLPLPTLAAHYLYASGIPFAIALGLLLVPQAEAGVSKKLRQRSMAFVGVVMIFLAGRSLFIQQEIYSVGKCQAVFLASFSPMAAEAIAGGSNRLHVTAAPGAREFVALRALFGRDAFSGHGKWPTVVGAAPMLERDSNLVMQPNCTVVPQ